jgi:hypothetical protein
VSQLKAAYPRDTKGRLDKNGDILAAWLRESLVPRPAPPPRPRPNDKRTLTVQEIGDYFIASIASRVGVCRGISRDRENAILRCRQLDSGSRPI